MVPSELPAHAGSKSYDEAYFKKWYRDPRTRVHAPEAVRRKVRMVVGAAEYFLGRKSLGAEVVLVDGEQVGAEPARALRLARDTESGATYGSVRSKSSTLSRSDMAAT